MQIRTKITLTFVLTSGLLLFLAFVSIYLLSAKIQRTDFREQLFKKASTTATLLISVEEVDSSLLKIIDQNKRDIYALENISIYAENGVELYTNNDSIHFSQILPDFDNTIKKLFTEGNFSFSKNEVEFVGGVHNYHGKRYAFLVGAKNNDGLLFLDRLIRTLIYVYFSILCITGYAGWIYAGNTLKPIKELMNEMENLSISNMRTKLKSIENGDEISRLINTYNKLLTRVQIAFEDQKAFISYASHELNNPLTSIHTQIDVSLIKTRSADEYKLILKQLKQDIIRLQDLTSQLLFLSKVSAESKIGNQQTFRIDELLISLKDQIENKYSLCTITLEFNLPENQNKLCVVDNYEIIFSALYNLIENGVKYSTNQMVTVKLSTIDSILIHVENLTDLLDDGELVKIFEPFYRNENSRQQKGYGLGLSIVKKIAVVNNYFLNVSLKDGRITFTLGL